MTARDLTASVLSAIQAREVSLIALFEGEFSSGTVNLWTGLGDLTWDSKTWTGAGNLIGWSAIEERDGVVASGVQVQFSGVPSAFVSLALDEARQGLPGRIWIGLLDSNGAVIADPFQAFSGKLDVPQITDSAEACVISIDYENKLVDLQRTREQRFTHEFQQALYPGDLGFEYVTTIQDQEIVWGTKS